MTTSLVSSRLAQNGSVPVHNSANTLRLGEIVPVGDLFGVMLEGHDAFSADMRQHFENARKLWEQKLKPLAEETAGLKYEDAAALPSDDARLRRLKENERIIGTLVLGALTPEVATLKSLTPRKLAALNHGSIQVAIPGTEAAAIWKKCQDWASRVGEIKINGEGVDATISLGHRSFLSERCWAFTRSGCCCLPNRKRNIARSPDPLRLEVCSKALGFPRSVA